MSDDNRSLCGYFLRNANALDDFYAASPPMPGSAMANTYPPGARRGYANGRTCRTVTRRPAPRRPFRRTVFRQQPDLLRPAARSARHHQRDCPGPGRLLRPHQRREPPARRWPAATPTATATTAAACWRAICSACASAIPYYYRNYLASKFPELCFDTNLGSNFITGASGLFDSLQESPPEPWPAPSRRIRRHRPAQGTPAWPSPTRANSAWTHNRCSTSMPWRKARAASTNWANTSRVHPAGRNPRWNSSS